MAFCLCKNLPAHIVLPRDAAAATPRASGSRAKKKPSNKDAPATSVPDLVAAAAADAAAAGDAPAPAATPAADGDGADGAKKQESRGRAKKKARDGADVAAAPPSLVLNMPPPPLVAGAMPPPPDGSPRDRSRTQSQEGLAFAPEGLPRAGDATAQSLVSPLGHDLGALDGAPAAGAPAQIDVRVLKTGRIGKILERRKAGWIYVQLDANPDEDGEAFNRKTFRSTDLVEFDEEGREIVKKTAKKPRAASEASVGGAAPRKKRHKKAKAGDAPAEAAPASPVDDGATEDGDAAMPLAPPATPAVAPPAAESPARGRRRSESGGGAPPRPRKDSDAGAPESGARFRVSVGKHAGRCGVVVSRNVSWTEFRLDGDAATVPVRKCWLVRVGEVGPAPASLERAKVDDSSLVKRRVRAAGCFTHDLNPTPYDGEVESHDAATNTYVVYWPADDSDTVYTERQLRRVLV
ncbi:hypothetical protein AURANDRAFT_68311 [Aureococcus anophagefferens]|uniref:Uncharacterized protein n=1 Tax=Aureococcus anophagefferens TaxID=44056 RepID=F0YP75_AURAN|nr:hypothetical protein AURANDRAFT_68311 [Aureococcus anophagefferens]EGB03084.1 hypothetical protein AURANDRAFT_68311 [Aureococcus anophagefferens]|eukprot:XP_009042221.1 hypothetical protein AURANDRAFT_68311 [Aureococcus anophagefferens]